MTDEWERLLLADPGAEDWVREEKRAERQRQHARELQASLDYAREYGWDVNPTTGQFLPPVSERECPCGIEPPHDLTTQDGAERCRLIAEELERNRRS